MRWWCIGAALMPLLLVQLLLHMYNVLHICTSLPLVLSLLCMLLYLLFVFPALHTLECSLPFHVNPRASALHTTLIFQNSFISPSLKSNTMYKVFQELRILSYAQTLTRFCLTFCAFELGLFLFPMHLDRPLRCHCWSFIPSAF